MHRPPDPAAARAALLDALFPGLPGRWPAFSAAVPPEAAARILGAAPEGAMMRRLEEVAKRGLPPEAGLAEWQKAAPEEFALLLAAARRAYYGAPATMAAAAAIAASGPREPSDRVDPSLVARVRAPRAWRNEGEAGHG